MQNSTAAAKRPGGQRRFYFIRMQIILTVADESMFEAADHLEQQPECALIWQSDLTGEEGRKLMADVLSQMKVPYIECPAEGIRAEDFEGCKSVVLPFRILRRWARRPWI